MNLNLLKESFGTLSETINGLVNLGYTHDFNIHEDCLVCHQNNIALSPIDFQIDKIYRFEGASNPEDQSILYAISSEKYNMKGVLVNGYGISSDEATSKLIEKLQLNKTQEAIAERPEANRILNAPLVEINLYHFMAQIKSETTWENSDRNAITVFKSATMSIVLMGLHKNAALKTHKANGVISIQVLEGKMEFSTEEETILMQKGQIIALEENINHSVIALEESFFLLTLAMRNKN